MRGNSIDLLFLLYLISVEYENNKSTLEEQ